MEGGDGPLVRRVLTEGGFGPRLFSGIALGCAAGLFAATVVGWSLTLGARAGLPLGGAAEAFRAWLASGGWLKVPMWGGAIATVLALPRAVNLPQRLIGAWFLFEFGVMPFMVHTGEAPPTADAPLAPVKTRMRAALKWSYRSPETVAKVVELSRDRDPMVREQAVMALGLNVVVDDIERATVTRPSRYSDHPVRAQLRARLDEALQDPVESIRAEAARALWKAPVAFGPAPAAAETLAAIIERAADPSRPERLAWCALDAAAAHPDPALRAAAERFAAATDDAKLARAARLAASVR